MVPVCYCTRMRLATRKMSALYDAALEPFGINIAQYALLKSIGRAQPVSLTELGRITALDRSTIGRNVRVLERMGHVATTRGEDQREAAVSLTNAAADMLSRAESAWKQVQDGIADRLGPGLTQALDDILQAL